MLACIWNSYCGANGFDTNVNTKVYIKIFEEFYIQLTDSMRSASFNKIEQLVTHLGNYWLAFMRLSQKNELSPKVCGHNVLWTCLHVIFIRGTSWSIILWQISTLWMNKYSNCIECTVLCQVYLNMIARAQKLYRCTWSTLSASFATINFHK